MTVNLSTVFAQTLPSTSKVLFISSDYNDYIGKHVIVDMKNGERKFGKLISVGSKKIKISNSQNYLIILNSYIRVISLKPSIVSGSSYYVRFGRRVIRLGIPGRGELGGTR
ncbi:MAG: hypothetical protein MJK14_10470 [Rivularia sp. ALOHA_DT_140]|nr:hypothetical protein [Rivularia sp. ALOHA_DT_140]